MQDYFGYRSRYVSLIHSHDATQAYTTPGVDDVMALLLALSASPEELELSMISVTYGNVPLEWYVSANAQSYRSIYSS